MRKSHFRYGDLENNDKLSILQNGSLFLIAVIGSDADNYTCKANNMYGSDVITYSLSVQGKFIPFNERFFAFFLLFLQMKLNKTRSSQLSMYTCIENLC
jgi:hypothetical protein